MDDIKEYRKIITEAYLTESEKARRHAILDIMHWLRNSEWNKNAEVKVKPPTTNEILTIKMHILIFKEIAKISHQITNMGYNVVDYYADSRYIGRGHLLNITVGFPELDEVNLTESEKARRRLMLDIMRWLGERGYQVIDTTVLDSGRFFVRIKSKDLDLGVFLGQLRKTFGSSIRDWAEWMGVLNLTFKLPNEDHPS